MTNVKNISFNELFPFTKNNPVSQPAYRLVLISVEIPFHPDCRSQLSSWVCLIPSENPISLEGHLVGLS